MRKGNYGRVTPQELRISNPQKENIEKRRRERKEKKTPNFSPSDEIARKTRNRPEGKGKGEKEEKGKDEGK